MADKTVDMCAKCDEVIAEAVGLLDEWKDSDFRVCAEVDTEDEPPCGDCYMCRTRDFIAKHGREKEDA